MQAELASCAGLGCNHFCRTCKAGGTKEWKQSSEGFSEILKVCTHVYLAPGLSHQERQAGEFRTSVETAEETFQQILTSLGPNVVTTLTDAVRASGIKDSLAQPIIDTLVKMGVELRKASPDGSTHSPDEVQTILTEELKKHQSQGAGITNPLIDMDGMGLFLHRCI